MKHAPVMLSEVIETLNPTDGGIYVDGTFGAGGYTRGILNAAKCRVIAFDQDATVQPVAQALEEEMDGRFMFILGNFADMREHLAARDIAKVDGVVLDIGVSSMQLDQPERGFSFRFDGPLDMRMSNQGRSAADIVAEASEEELADIFYHYGEERAARRIARAIVRAREEAPITRTSELAKLVASVVPGGAKDPATRTFQALRIVVNDELGALERALEAAEQILAPDGRLVVVTFHSLEDRIVKNYLHSRCGKTGGGSRHLPELPADRVPPAFFLGRPEKKTPSKDEQQRNPRSRSAKLRHAVRTDAPCQQAGAV